VDIHAQRRSGEGLLEDPLAAVAGEEQRVRPGGRDGRQQSQLWNTQILRLVHHHMIEGLVGPGSIIGGRPAEDLRPGQQPALCQGGARRREDRPQPLSLCPALIRLLRPRRGTVA
jgi:hypothetical protein